jgi:hypothetical protein
MALIHGMRKTPTYESWAHMIQRCTNPNADQFPYYGGRGIRVCPAWQKFENFMADMGVRPEGTALDRIDPDGNYEPANCQWSRNKAKNRRNTRWFEVDGNPLPLSLAARKCGVTPNAFRQRLNAGWDEKQIVDFYLKRKEGV